MFHLYSTKLSTDSIVANPVQLGSDSGVETCLRPSTECSTTDHANGIHPTIWGVCVVDTATRVILKWKERQEIIRRPQYLFLPPVIPGKNPSLEQKCKSWCQCPLWDCRPCISSGSSSSDQPSAISLTVVPQIQWRPIRRQWRDRFQICCS